MSTPIRSRLGRVKSKSRRQEVSDYAFNGGLRHTLETNATGLSEDAINLLVDIVMRYCTNKPTKN